MKSDYFCKRRLTALLRHFNRSSEPISREHAQPVLHAYFGESISDKIRLQSAGRDQSRT
jgi:hypothetical protein